jgi:glycosyltransferase involved in cell wall biosynthesis
MVPENDVAALRQRILYLADNDDECKRLSANARQDILSRASIESMFGGFLACAESLASARRHPAES